MKAPARDFTGGRLAAALPYLALVAAVLPLMLWRDFTPDNELRYLSIADEALREGRFWTFTNHGAIYADKPPLYLWLVMAARAVAGSHCITLLSLLSLAPALLVAALCGRMARGWITTRWRLAMPWMLLTTAYFLALAVVLRMDMLLTLFIFLAIAVFMRLREAPAGSGRLRRLQWLFALWVFMGLFVKGPMGVLVPLGSTALFALWEGQWRPFARAWGWRCWLLLAGLCAVWWGCVALEGGLEYLNNLLFHQTVDRAVDAFHHKRPFWHYCASFWYVTAPFGLFLAAAIAVTAVRHRWRCGPKARMAASVIVATMVMLSCISSKVDVYLLPLVPFFVLLGTRALDLGGGRPWGVRACLMLPALAFVAVPAVMAVMGLSGEMPSLAPWLWTGAGLLCLGGLLTLWLTIRCRLAAATQAMAATMLATVLALSTSITRLNPSVGYAAVASEAAALAGPEGRVVTYYVSRPENIDVYIGRPVTIVRSPAEIAALPLDKPVAAIVATNHLTEFNAAIQSETHVCCVIDQYTLVTVSHAHNQPDAPR